MGLYSSCVKRLITWRKYFVIAGGIFIYLPIGVPWYFGNLATYIISYYHSQVSSETDLVDPQWIFSAFFIAFSLAITASGYISHWVGTRITVAIAILIHSGATLLSFFAIQHSMAALILTFGALGGWGAGLAYGPPLPVVIKWMPRRVGLASGALMTGFGGGAVFYNELITFFINPGNIKPDVVGARTTYFSQEEVLSRVPELFLLLGVLTIILQVIGLLMLREPREGDEIEEIELTEIKPIVPADSKMSTSGGTDNPALNGVNGDTISTTSETASQREVKVEDLEPEKTPLEVLRTSEFYILWLALSFNHYGYVIKNNYYKEFGQLKIDNDHFLTTTGTIATIGVSLARVLWGLMTDWLGAKMTLLLFSASTTVATSLWYFSIHVNAGFYMFWIVLVSAIFTGAFILFPLAMLRAFGEKHYAKNYGLLLTAQIVVALISPPIIRQLIYHFDWFGLFVSIAIVNAIATVALLFLKER